MYFTLTLDSGESVYVRWGHTSCPSTGAQLDDYVVATMLGMKETTV